MKKRAVILAIVASALGFFVDLYDIIIVSIVRKPSLLAVGVAELQHARGLVQADRDGHPGLSAHARARCSPAGLAR